MRKLFDFKLYLDISDEVKFAWKIQARQRNVFANTPTLGAALLHMAEQ